MLTQMHDRKLSLTDWRHNRVGVCTLAGEWESKYHMDDECESGVAVAFCRVGINSSVLCLSLKAGGAGTRGELESTLGVYSLLVKKIHEEQYFLK